MSHYDRQGRPIPLEVWVAFQTPEYKRVAATDVGPYWVSTVWLGLDYGFSFGEAPPIIFETMVWRGTESDLACLRWPTEAAALAGHDQVVAALRDGVDPSEL